VRLQISNCARDLALFNLAIDSKLRACDLVKLRVRDVFHAERVAVRAVVMQHKTQRPVQFEITEPTRAAVATWIARAHLRPEDFLFPSRLHTSPHLSTRQYARIVDCWVREIGLDPSAYATHTMRRTKVSLIYRRTKNLMAVQLLLGHTKLESTVGYLKIEVDDALEDRDVTSLPVGDHGWSLTGQKLPSSLLPHSSRSTVLSTQYCCSTNARRHRISTNAALC
jgi:integrase